MAVPIVDCARGANCGDFGVMNSAPTLDVMSLAIGFVIGPLFLHFDRLSNMHKVKPVATALGAAPIVLR